MDIATFHANRRFADVSSGRIAYLDQGKGPVALFIHGVPLNGYHWRHVIKRVRHRRRCIAIDLMGLGYSEIAPAQDVSFATQARMIASCGASMTSSSTKSGLIGSKTPSRAPSA